MTPAEVEIVADAGCRLNELRMRLLRPADLTDADFLTLALDVSKVYGLLSCLPLENEWPTASSGEAGGLVTAALQSLGIGAGAGLILYALVEAWARRWGRQWTEDDRD